MKLNHHFISHAKINRNVLKTYIQGLDYENPGGQNIENLHGIGLGNDLMIMTSKSRQ